MDSALENFYDKFLQMLFANHLLWKVALGLICLFCAFSAVKAVYNRYKREWESFYFIWLCAAVFLWSAFSLLSLVFAGHMAEHIFFSLSRVGFTFMPALLCLHIWKQVSYKDITWQVLAFFLCVPAIHTVGMFKDILFLTLQLPPSELFRLPLFTVIYYLYIVAMLVQSYLLCFNVFYQMPPHMRKSSYYLLTGISFVTAAFVLQRLFNIAPDIDLPLIASAIAIFFFSDALHAASSANVIVTSRDFVFSNLSTLILVLSHKQRILDWNKKEPDSLDHLPHPAYREPFANYCQRMIEDGNGRVSAHGDNIITTMYGDLEKHYLITMHEVRQKKRELGYIAEISEVTNVYTVIRYLEEIATIDQLTGLNNRNAYLNRVNSMVQAENMPLLVLVGDVNNLKQLNDTYGHLRGDALLISVSNIIKANAPENSFVSRIGGDEFVLLLAKGTEQDAKIFIEKTQQACANTQDTSFGEASISWGYAIMQDEEQSYNKVFALADQMMYADKKENFTFRSSGLLPSGTKNDKKAKKSTVASKSEKASFPAEITEGEESAETAAQNIQTSSKSRRRRRKRKK